LIVYGACVLRSQLEGPNEPPRDLDVAVLANPTQGAIVVDARVLGCQREWHYEPLRGL
jgi:hypothetical protein